MQPRATNGAGEVKESFHIRMKIEDGVIKFGSGGGRITGAVRGGGEESISPIARVSPLPERELIPIRFPLRKKTTKGSELF